MHYPVTITACDFHENSFCNILRFKEPDISLEKARLLFLTNIQTKKNNNNNLSMK